MNTQQMKRCPRCLGQKKMYKMGNGYSAANCGGPQVDCPCCAGVGSIKKLEATLAEIPFLENVSYETVTIPIKSENSKRGRPKKEAQL